MSPVLALLCLVAAVTSSPHDKRIINGNVAELYSHPYIVSLQRYVPPRSWFQPGVWDHFCGGSLIAEDWVLTAAHCVEKVSNLNYIRVVVGAMNLYTTPNSYRQNVDVAMIIIHAGWVINGPKIQPNDIALIRLSRKVNLNKNVQIATLADGNLSFLGQECVLAGWGREANGQLARELKEVSITKISNSKCNYLWRGRITDSHICVHDASPPAGGRPGACDGDSGGPMMCGPGHNILAGVTSWGDKTCKVNLPSVYTRVSAYRGWIAQFTGV